MKKSVLLVVLIIMLGISGYRLYQNYGYMVYQPKAPICYDTETPINYVDSRNGVLLDAYDGDVLIETSYTSVSLQNEKYIMFTHLEKQGLFTRSCEVIVDAVYDEIVTAEVAEDIFVIVARNDEEYYVLNEEGTVISEAYDSLPINTLKYAPLYQSLVPIEGQDAPFYLIASKDGQYGLINHKAEVIVPFEYDDLEYRTYANRVYIARKGDEYGLIDYDNTILFPFGNFKIKDRIYQNKTTDKYGVLSKDGLFYTDALYDYIDDKWPDYYFVRLQHKWGVVDSNGNLLLDTIYEDVSWVYESDDYFIVNNGDHYGIINSLGEIIIPFEYDDLSIFVSHSEYRIETLYRATKDGLTGLINNDNDEIIPFLYDKIENMYYKSYVDYIIAVKDQDYGVIDFNNNIIVPFDYKDVSPHGENEIKVIDYNDSEEIIEYEITP